MPVNGISGIHVYRTVTRGRSGGESPAKFFAPPGKMLGMVENYWT